MRLITFLLRRAKQRPISFKAASSNPPTQSSSRTKRGPPPLSLDQFIQRQRVLSLWRTILRSIYLMPRAKRVETVAYAREEFERNKNVKDITQIRYLISTGKTEFEKMERYIHEMAAR